MAHEAARTQRDITPEEWPRIREILANALELPVAERGAYLDRSCGDDSRLRLRLDDLIAADQATLRSGLDVPALSLTSPEFASAEPRSSVIGRRIGAYRLEAEIAHGGMGTVFRAVRADDEFKKQVAIKLMGGAGLSSYAAELLRRERQVLANLEHPNIARLLDGGTTQDGIPYLVMEYVEGRPVTQYCKSLHLSFDERLRIFLKICSAVHYAHQHLVIHRDIKPANILVLPQGEPKLLDFGIAKIIDLDAGENATATAWQALTPSYASPEQVSGEPITTATDVYSLGLLLYELLTDAQAFNSRAMSPLQLQRAIMEQDPAPPSKAILLQAAPNREQLAHLLRGDLDSIVAKAIRKRREERYSSVEQFAEDIRRHLQKLPVSAHQDTLRYRTNKFVRRHRGSILAAALVLVSLLAGIVLTAREARIARVQQLRAERRFNDVRKLSNSLIFEIHDSIQGLPGATTARKLLLARAREYLDDLAAESSSDVPLQRDLAAAYQRIGQLQGNSLDSNTGETEAGIVSLQKAVSILDRIAATNATDFADQLAAAQGHTALSSLLGSSGRREARQELDKAIAISNRLMSIDPSNSKLLIERGVEYDHLASFQEDAGEIEGAAESLRKGLASAEALLRSDPQDAKQMNRVAIGRVRLGNELAMLGRRKEALELNGTGLQLYEKLTQDPTNVKARREMGVTLAFRGSILMQEGDSAAALEVYRRSLAILEDLQKTDAQSVLYRLDLAGAWASVGRALGETDRASSGIDLLDRAIEVYREGIARDPSYTDLPYLLALSEAWKGETLARRGELDPALAAYRAGAAELEGLLSRADTEAQRCDLAAIYARGAGFMFRAAEYQDAIGGYERALKLAEPLAAKSPANTLALYAVADAYFGMGELSRIAAQHTHTGAWEQKQRWSQAREWYRKSAASWNRIPNPGHETPTGLPALDPKRLTARMREVDQELAGLSQSSGRR